MRKLLHLVLSLLMIFSLFGCSNKDSIQDPITFYYLNKEMEYGNNPSVIGSEIRDATGLRGDPGRLLELYLHGPEDYTLRSPFSSRTALISLELKSDTAYLQLNYALAGLSGMELSLACACITLTVCEMTGAHKVDISVPGTQLDGKTSITMSPESILLLDNSNVVIDPN